jgi:hypothetical protein
VVLDQLVDSALRARKFTFRQPRYPVERPEDVPEQESGVLGSGDGGAGADQSGASGDIEDEFDDDDAEDGGGGMGDAVGAFGAGGGRRGDDGGDGNDGLPFGGKGGAARQDILKADVGAAAWRTEYERVLPQLKVQIRADSKDWRAHVAEMTKLQAGIKGSLSETQVYLDRLHTEITSTLEKIDSREKYVNKQLENPVTEYRRQQDALAAAVERYGDHHSLALTLVLCCDEMCCAVLRCVDCPVRGPAS